MKKLKLWWKFEGQYIPWTIKNGIKNLIYWFKIIWNDRVFNNNYIYTILIHKILAVKANLNKIQYVDREETDKKIDLILSLLDKIKENYYSIEYSNYHKTKYEFIPLENSEQYKGCYTMEVTELSENFDDYFIKHLSKYRKVNGTLLYKSEHNKCDMAREIGRISEEQAKRLLWNLIHKNIDKW